jgi:hypothetical protein
LLSFSTQKSQNDSIALGQATAIRRAEMETNRILLQPGECAVVDNYRFFHARFHAREAFAMAPTRRTIYQVRKTPQVGPEERRPKLGQL